MRCPICQISLKPETFHGEAIDRCSACDGIWLDPSELGSIVQNIEPPTTVRNGESPALEGVACPKCGDEHGDERGGVLTPFNYAHDSGVLIHRCDSCRGNWLAQGQLEMIARYRAGTPAVRSLEQALADEMRTSKLREAARRLLRSKWLSGLVLAVYLLLFVVLPGQPRNLYAVILFVWLPLICIWWPDYLGRLTGVRFSLSFFTPVTTRSTPGDAVAICGWVLLVFPLLWLAWLRGLAG